MNGLEINVGDCLEVMKAMPDQSVHCIVTSPPYWGLRDYGVAGQLGMEKTPEEYVVRMVEVFREARRVLRDDGTLWLNVGDSYNGSGKKDIQVNSPKQMTSAGARSQRGTNINTLKAKDLIGIPWRLAFALQADGWWLRQDIIWAKPNPMPESVTDRCTKSHEYIFLMSKSQSYYYDHEAIKEPASYAGAPRGGSTNRYEQNSAGMDNKLYETRNKRSVWTVIPKPFKGAHFATFPPDLIEPCILAGTSSHGCCSKCLAPWARKVERKPMVVDRGERTHELGRTRTSGHMVEAPSSVTIGWKDSCSCGADTIPCTVLDPFGGAGTTGLVSLKHHRRCVLIELNPEYANMAANRIVSEFEGEPLLRSLT